MAKKLTKLQREYKRQIYRLNSVINKLNKQGYTIQKYSTALPKRVTKKQISEIKSIKPTIIKRRVAKQIPLPTTKILIHNKKPIQTQAPEQQKPKAISRYDMSLHIISNFRAELQTYPQAFRGILLKWLDEMVDDKGVIGAAEHIQNAPDAFHEAFQRNKHDYGKAWGDFLYGVTGLTEEFNSEELSNLEEAAFGEDFEWDEIWD